MDNGLICECKDHKVRYSLLVSLRYGEIRDREKVFRGLKKMDTAIIDGMRVYYNFTKKHGALKGQTPAESAMIKIDGANKWKTIIQNASLYKENSV